MEEWGLFIIERINMVDPTFVQNRRNSVRNQPKFCADGGKAMTEAHDGFFIAAFFDGFDRCVLSVHQHLRPQEKEVAVIAGVDIKVGIHLNVYETLHGHWSIHINNDATTPRSSQPLPLIMPHPKCSIYGRIWGNSI